VLGAGELGAGELGGELGAAGSGRSGFRSCAVTRGDAKQNAINAKAKKLTLTAGTLVFMRSSLGERTIDGEELLRPHYTPIVEKL